MGLLTDPSAGQGKIIKLLLKYYSKLCILLYLSGIIYFCSLAYSPLNGGTYFSENALLPGLVKSEFKEENAAKLFHEELLDEMKKYDNAIPYPWLTAKFRQFGLDTYTHNFTLNYPLGAPQKFTGKNVYGIIRAARASSTEALVMSVPYRPPASVHQSTAPSIAIMLAFAQFAVKQKYWAKDIILLVTEHEQLGMQAWLEAYHGVTCGRKNTLIAGDMKGRAGAIQAAINLEIHDVQIGQIDLKIEGLNGQLPNLDLFNLAARMCMKEGIHLTFKNRATKKFRDAIKDWSYSFQTLMGMVSTQATGVPNGNHGLFFRFGIQAVTIEGFSPLKHRGSRAGFYTMGRILEGTFRSLNNLLERFHQSFFFYLLPSTDRYISIGLYMPAICLLVSTLFIKLYAKWCQLHENSNSDSNSDTEESEKSIKTQKTVKKKTLSKAEINKLNHKYDNVTMEEWTEKFNLETQKEGSSTNGLSLGHICLVFVLSHIVGFSLKDLPKYISLIGLYFGYTTDVSVFYGFVALSFLSLIVPEFIKKPCFNSLAFLNILSLLELGTTLICISMYNISLGMFLAVIYIPMALLINPSNCGLCNKLQKILWTSVHPMLVLCVTVFLYTLMTFSNEPFQEIFFRCIKATQQALIFSIIDSVIYGNWLYNVITGIFVSNWLCFWYVSCSKGNENMIQTSQKKKD